VSEPLPERKWRRLGGFDYTARLPYFVTICTAGRECVLGDIRGGKIRLSQRGRVVKDCWAAIPAHFPHVMLDAWCVMPNHLHGILCFVDDVRATHASSATAVPHGPARGSLGAVMGAFKSSVSREINKLRPGTGDDFWLRNYYDHIVRTPRAMDAIRKYIMLNTVNWHRDEHNRDAAGVVAMSSWLESLYPPADDACVAPTSEPQ
jgi:putative transposase